MCKNKTEYGVAARGGGPGDLLCPDVHESFYSCFPRGCEACKRVFAQERM